MDALYDTATFLISRNMMTMMLMLTLLLRPVVPSSISTVAPFDRPASEAANCFCKFPKHNEQDAILEKIKPLCGNRYDTADHSPDGYIYNVGICVSGQQPPVLGMEQSGAVQTHKLIKDVTVNDNRFHSIGSFERAEVMAGTNWIILEYEGGDNFHTHCKNENRRTVIMILCKEGESTGQMRWIEENSNKTEDCYYLFELDHEAACSVQQQSGLGIGSVVCIVLTVVVSVYLIGGILFMRLVRGAKGLKQIPNYSFWRDFGALQADGCDLICRCGGQQKESSYYHGIGDHQIECAADSEEVDEHLLPM